MKKKSTKSSTKAKKRVSSAKTSKRVTKSTKLKAHQSKFGKMNKTAFDEAYKDGQKGNPKKSPKVYFKKARQILF